MAAECLRTWLNLALPGPTTGDRGSVRGPGIGGPQRLAAERSPIGGFEDGLGIGARGSDPAIANCSQRSVIHIRQNRGSHSSDQVLYKVIAVRTSVRMRRYQIGCPVSVAGTVVVSLSVKWPVRLRTRRQNITKMGQLDARIEHISIQDTGETMCCLNKGRRTCI